MRGTLLNTATVLVGALLGLALAGVLPSAWKEVALTGLGLVNLVMGMRMALRSKNLLIMAGSLALGGILGAALGITPGLQAFADWARTMVGGGGRFNEGLLTTSILFCVGPMVILGCLEDGLEGKIDLLAMKSLLDGIAAIFFAAALGGGVVVTALVVLVFQGLLTLCARPLRPLAQNEDALAELSGVGGALLLAIGLGLAGIKAIPTETYLPALVIAPAMVMVGQRFRRNAGNATGEPG